MDVSGLVFRQVPCMGARYRIIGDRDLRVCSRPRIVDSVSGGFRDDGHIQYYKSGWPRSRCETKKQEMDSTKKKLKLLKGLTRDLSTFSGMDHHHTHVLVSQLQGKTLSEAAQILLKQLQLLKAEEKELKRKRKQEKARLKAQRMEAKLESESSESSDSECGEVVDMSGMRNEAAASPGTFTQESTASTLPAFLPQELNKAEEIISLDCNLSCDRGEESCIGPSRSSNYSSIVDCQVRNASRIEICMGGKCKKSGGAALLEEFGRVMGVEGAAVGCKCMGKCRDGPNVRILNEDDSARTPAYPLCIGVGLEDVGVIVANFFGQKKTRVLGLNPSS